MEPETREKILEKHVENALFLCMAAFMLAVIGFMCWMMVEASGGPRWLAVTMGIGGPTAMALPFGLYYAAPKTFWWLRPIGRALGRFMGEPQRARTQRQEARGGPNLQIQAGGDVNIDRSRFEVDDKSGKK